MSGSRHLLRTLPLAALLFTGAAAATAMLLDPPAAAPVLPLSQDTPAAPQGVVVVPVRTSRRPVILEANGVTSPLSGSQARVTAPFAGRVAEVLVELGQPVAAGQPIALIEPIDWEPAHSSSSDSVSPSPPLPLSTAPQAPRPLRAPRAGIVEDLRLEGGQMVMRGQPVAELVDTRRLRTVVQLPAGINDQLPTGHPAVLTAPWLRGELFDARVQTVTPTSEDGEDGLAVTLNVANPRGLLEVGTAVVAYVRVRPRRAALLIPFRCLFDRYGEPGVRVVTPEGTVESRSIRTAAEGAGVVRVTGGLNEGERVVLDGSLALLNGDHVTVRSWEEVTPGHE